MRRRYVDALTLLAFLLMVGGCATTELAQKDDSASKMARTLSVGGRHCH